MRRENMDSPGIEAIKSLILGFSTFKLVRNTFLFFIRQTKTFSHSSLKRQNDFLCHLCLSEYIKHYSEF